MEKTINAYKIKRLNISNITANIKTEMTQVETVPLPLKCKIVRTKCITRDSLKNFLHTYTLLVIP